MDTKNGAWVAVVTSSILALCTVPVSADVVAIGASHDNTMFEEDSILSNGAGEFFFTGLTRDTVLRRGLIAFDVAGAIPAGSTVNSVTLTLYMSRTKTGDMDVDLHKVQAAWGEGTSHASGEEGGGDAATNGDATWMYRLFDENDPPNSPAWTTPGGDYAPTPSGTAVVGNRMAFYSWSSAGMVTDVQAWLDTPGTNYGWIVIGNAVDDRDTKRFNTHENTDTATRPELVVDFTPPALTGACCAADGTCTVVLDPGTNCTGTYQGAGTDCTPNPCPEPDGACCLPDASGTCVETTATDCAAQGGTFQGDLTTCGGATCPVVLEPFVDPLPLPAVAQPITGTPGGAATYDLAIRQVQQQLHRDLPPTTVWGYGDGPTGAAYPGPTLETTTGEPITVNWINDLRDGGGALRTDHYLNVDLCPHGAVNLPKIVVHLHGGHVPAAVDGYPEATFLPGEQVTYDYPNNQLPGTLWYHDHALGITRLNVYMGLAGFYLVRDAVEAALGLPSGEFEVALAVQDRTFNPDGSLSYPATWQDHFFGDTILVNGKVWPYFNVKQGKYRFRLLGGSSSRTYHLTLSTGDPFVQIGTEGGLLPAPVTVSSITLPPGERADVIIDFAGHAPGTQIDLLNSAPAPYPGTPGVGVIPDVMRFIVQDQPGHTDAIPSTLRAMEVLDELDATETRDFVLEKGSDPCSGQVWLINGLGWDDVTEFPELGATEVWRFINQSGNMHPMHMHLVFFQVLDRQAFDDSSGSIVPIGSPMPPPPEEAGWKDTVKVAPNEIVRVIARFEDYTGKYPYHCHILEHEDHEMMRQFQVVCPAAAAIPAVTFKGVLALIFFLAVTGAIVVRSRSTARTV